MNRRKFAFWIGASLFGLSGKLRAESLDKIAAAVMLCTESHVDGKRCVEQVEWAYQEDDDWRWFERKTLIHEQGADDQWKLTGRTRPVHRRTGELAEDQPGYLDENLVPHEVRFGGGTNVTDQTPIEHEHEEAEDEDYGEANPARKARNGLPPSKWLRSLYSEELRLWLPEIEVPAVGVSGMTVWIHLTRDHAFDPERIESLNEVELAKLHAAAHFGY